MLDAKKYKTKICINQFVNFVIFFYLNKCTIIKLYFFFIFFIAKSYIIISNNYISICYIMDQNF